MAKILVTDDAKFMRTMLSGFLTAEGHEVIEAGNGIEMLNMYKEHKPDLITLDITMPEMDGLEAIKKLRMMYPTAKVIMCSAMGQQSMVIEALQNGAIDFIVKPFQQDRVIDSVKKALAK